MKQIKARTLPSIAALTSWIMLAQPGAYAQLWLEFAHPDEPHQTSSSFAPFVFPELFDNQGLNIQVPVVVVLMEFTDETHDPQNTPADFEDIFFGPGGTSVQDYYEQTSNGRVSIFPAAETHGTVNDGVIGWEMIPFGTDELEGDEERAQAVYLADTYMDFSLYDTNTDLIVSPHELVLMLVKPGDGIGGVTIATNPAQIIADGVVVELPIGALTEVSTEPHFAHETGHPFFGHGDLYCKCCPEDGIACSVGDPTWLVGEGYICNTLSDDCTFPGNGSCECPDALNPTPASATVGDTSDLALTFTPACGEVGDLFGHVAWYEVYGNGNTFTATTCSSATSIDTRLTVYCNGCDELTCLDGNDDDGACGFDPSHSTVSWCTKPDASYLIAVESTLQGTGAFGLIVTDTESECLAPEDCGFAAADSRHWYPFKPDWMSIMGSGYSCQEGTNVEQDPWAKIHLGFTKPKVITHDGTYQVYAAETIRSFAQQDAEPEAYIVYDPLRPPDERYGEYFIIENRNDPTAYDQGLGIWLINENDWLPPFPGVYSNVRHVVRLIHRGGIDPDLSSFLWDADYDWTATSEPRNSAWSDGRPSYVSVYNISESGDVMTFSVNMPPLFVDIDNDSGMEDGSSEFPFLFLADGVANILEPPRSIRIAGGDYPDAFTISTPCTIAHWKDGDAIIGTP